MNSSNSNENLTINSDKLVKAENNDINISGNLTLESSQSISINNTKIHSKDSSTILINSPEMLVDENSKLLKGNSRIEYRSNSS